MWAGVGARLCFVCLFVQAIVAQSGRFPSKDTEAGRKGDLARKMLEVNGLELTPENHSTIIGEMLVAGGVSKGEVDGQITHWTRVNAHQELEEVREGGYSAWIQIRTVCFTFVF
jgi:hypothetical protein